MSQGPPIPSVEIGDVSVVNGINVTGHVGGSVTINGAPRHKETVEETAARCREALFLFEPESQRAELKDTKGSRTPQTCEWITRREAYLHWLDGTSPLLWISGEPGKGKTIMSIMLTEAIESRCRTLELTDVIYFFCLYRDQKCNTAVAILRGLLWQMIGKRPSLASHAAPYFESEERTRQALSSVDTLWSIFKDTLRDATLGTMFCVLDGLDECNKVETRKFLSRILDQANTTKGFRLLVVSRNLPGLQAIPAICLEDRDNNEEVKLDIERSIAARVTELEGIDKFDTIRRLVHTALLDGAKETFLWVGFVMHELLEKETCSQIVEALKTLPEDLKAIYDRMLLKIPRNKVDMCVRILRWVTLAVRPLSLLELADAVGLQSISDQITLEQAMRDELTLLGPLITIQQDHVSLVHQSAQEYLLRQEPSGDVALEAFRMRKEDVHFELAQSCLHRISRSRLSSAPLKMRSGFFQFDTPFLCYATFQWTQHVIGCPSLAASLLDRSEPFFQDESVIRMNWCSMIDVNQSVSQRDTYWWIPTMPLLHMACVLKIYPWVNEITRPGGSFENDNPLTVQTRSEGSVQATITNSGNGGLDVSMNQAWNGLTALHLAIKSGDPDIVRLLIERGSNIHAICAEGKILMTALQVAVFGFEDRFSVVKVLLDSGATTIPVEDNMGIGPSMRGVLPKWFSGAIKTVLPGAIRYQSMATIKLLFDKAANVQIPKVESEEILWRAFVNHTIHDDEWDELIKLLLSRGAQLDSQDSNGMTALHIAAGNVVESRVLRVLLETGARSDMRNNEGDTVLHSLSYNSYMKGLELESALLLLIENGADIEAINNIGLTPWQLAVKTSHLELAQQLFDQGALADTQASEHDGQTLLHHAARVGHVESARLLIDTGADVDAADHQGKTPLQFAAACGDVEMARFLIDRGANISARDNKYMTVLHHAAMSYYNTVKSDRMRIFELLSDRGANKHAVDIYGATILHAAATQGQIEVIQYFLDAGIDINAKASSLEAYSGLSQRRWEWSRKHRLQRYEGYTALVVAIYNRHTEAAQFLIERGADLEAPGCCNPLHMAVSKALENTLSLLLDAGADINARDNSGRTALIDAASDNNVGCTILLIERGADVKFKDERGRTALVWAATHLNDRIAERLIARGADVRVKDDQGRTALHHLTAPNMFLYQMGDMKQFFELLVRNGADVNAEDNIAETALFSKAVSELLEDGKRPPYRSYCEDIVALRNIYAPKRSCIIM